MDKITFHFSKLNFDEMLELQALQRKMREATGSIEGYSALTVDELIRLEDLHYTMAGLENPRKPAPPYVPVIMTRSGVTAAVTSQLEPVAIAPAAAPAAPAAPATPAQPEKPKRPPEDVESGLRQLDSLMRFAG